LRAKERERACSRSSNRLMRRQTDGRSPFKCCTSSSSEAENEAEAYLESQLCVMSAAEEEAESVVATAAEGDEERSSWLLLKTNYDRQTEIILGAIFAAFALLGK
jgi:hypothetical protein